MKITSSTKWQGCVSHSCFADFFRQRREAEERERDLKRREKVRARRERQLDREEKRRMQREEKRRKEEERQMQLRIAMEERRILIAQRKLQTIRLLSELFHRIKVRSTSGICIPTFEPQLQGWLRDGADDRVNMTKGRFRNYPGGGHIFFQTPPPPGQTWSQSPPTPRTRKCFN